MRTIKILTIVLMSVLFFACKKKITYYLPDEIKPYIMFPEGSYWVYQDSTLGSIDTVTLTKQYIEKVISSSIGNEIELLRQEFYSSFKKTSFLGGTLNFNNENYYQEDAIFFLGEIGEEGFYNHFIDTIINNYQPFNKKTIVIRTFPIGEDKLVNFNYWSENIGIVKHVELIFLTDTLIVKNLIDYHINN